jgi:integrase
VVAQDGTRRSLIVATQAAAERLRADLERELEEEAVTMSEALLLYEQYLVAKGNKPRSIETTMQRLRGMLPGDQVLADLTAKACERLYTELRARPRRRRAGLEVREVEGERAVDTHRNTLGQAKTFLRWCRRKGWIKGEPMEDVEGVGRRRRRKVQLRLDEARALVGVALEAAAGGEPGGLAAALALLLGLRASEVVAIVARDVDDGGAMLWIEEQKNEAAKGVLEVPAILVAPLATARAAVGQGPLFPGRTRHWVLREVKRLCRVAGVPPVTAHGLRGTHSSIATDAGATGRIVADALRHSEAVNAAHYTEPDAARRGQIRRAALKLVP